MNICKVQGCLNDVTGKSYRCGEHSTTCIAEGCDVESTAVRCSKHAARYSRIGRSYMTCHHAGCQSAPTGDRDECPRHAIEVSDLQRQLDAAHALL